MGTAILTWSVLACLILVTEATKCNSWKNLKRVVALQLASSSAVSAIPLDSLSSINTDEIVVSIPRGTTSLGLGLKDENYRGSIRIGVQSIKENAPRVLEEKVKPGYLISSINGRNVEGYNLKRVAEMVKNTLDDRGELTLVFRNPSAFIEAMDSRDPQAPSIVTTLILPGDKEGARGGENRDQLLKIERLERGAQDRTNVADVGDVLEVSFQLRIKDTGEVIDGMKELEAAGSSFGGSGNMFFVLGSGRYDNPSLGSNVRDDILPPGWDMYTRGMIIDELRRITIPPIMGIGAKGYHPSKSLAAERGEVRVEGDLRRGNVVAKRDEGERKLVPLDNLLKKHATSDLELDVRLLTINGER